MSRHTYRATVAYDGSRFCGYSLQDDEHTVEGALLAALQPLMPELPRVACGGRTDKGVHAIAQVISFYTRRALSTDSLLSAIGAADDALTVSDVSEVERNFHASFSAVGRRYAYFHDDDGSLDVARLDAMLRELVGERCFSAFARDTPTGASTVRQLYTASAIRVAPDRIRFDFHANGFLRRQVRVMVATAIRSSSKAPIDALVRLAATGDRDVTAPAADAGGLYLVGVDYPWAPVR